MRSRIPKTVSDKAMNALRNHRKELLDAIDAERSNRRAGNSRYVLKRVGISSNL